MDVYKCGNSYGSDNLIELNVNQTKETGIKCQII